MSTSLRRLATRTCSTKRPPAMSAGGKKGPAVAHLSDLRCTPPAPLSSLGNEVRVRDGLGAPHELQEVYLFTENDIVGGDYLVIGDREYPIKYVGAWDFFGNPALMLLLEVLKR